MFILCSSWNSSLQAYGIFSLEMLPASKSIAEIVGEEVGVQSCTLTSREGNKESCGWTERGGGGRERRSYRKSGSTGTSRSNQGGHISNMRVPGEGHQARGVSAWRNLVARLVASWRQDVHPNPIDNEWCCLGDTAAMTISAMVHLMPMRESGRRWGCYDIRHSGKNLPHLERVRGNHEPL